MEIGNKKHRFETLDALRGLAALFVVQIHMPFLFAKSLPFAHAYLAVDFFFMLSGFVLSYAYGERLSEGWPTLLFFRERLIRLYPLFALSLPLGVLHLVFTSRRDHLTLPLAEAPVLIFCTLLLIPLPTWIQSGQISAFPVNGPSWSLSLELVANLLHATVLRRRTLPQLIVIALFWNIPLVVFSIYYHGIEFGFLKGQFLIGVVRVMASYTYGMVLFRLWPRDLVLQQRYALLSGGLLLIVLMSPLPRYYTAASDLAAVWIAFPIVILAGARAKLPSSLGWSLRMMGVASYAIYILHPAIFTLYTSVWTTVLHSKPLDFAPRSGFLFLIVVVVLSLLADRYWDTPIRGYFKRLTRRT